MKNGDVSRRGGRYLAKVAVNEIVEGVGLRVSILEHPEQVFEEDNLARDIDGSVIMGVAGPLRQLAEERVTDDVGADEVAPPRFTDIHRLHL